MYIPAKCLSSTQEIGRAMPYTCGLKAYTELTQPSKQRMSIKDEHGLYHTRADWTRTTMEDQPTSLDNQTNPSTMEGAKSDTGTSMLCTSSLPPTR